MLNHVMQPPRGCRYPGFPGKAQTSGNGLIHFNFLRREGPVFFFSLFQTRATAANPAKKARVNRIKHLPSQMPIVFAGYLPTKK
jgi:hypothetical protein